MPTHAPPPAAATVAGEAPASRSWFCREKSMLYHSAALSTGFGGMTRLGFSRTSRTYKHRVLTLLYYHLESFLSSIRVAVVPPNLSGSERPRAASPGGFYSAPTFSAFHICRKKAQHHKLFVYKIRLVHNFLQRSDCRTCKANLHSPSGMSSRLLLAAMNSVRLDNLPTPGGTPSKSSLLEFTYSFFSLDSLQMADWRQTQRKQRLKS